MKRRKHKRTKVSAYKRGYYRGVKHGLAKAAHDYEPKLTALANAAESSNNSISDKTSFKYQGAVEVLNLFAKIVGR